MSNKDYNILVGFSNHDYPSVQSFQDIGQCTFHRYDEAFLNENISKYDIFIPHLFLPISKPIIEKAENLKILATPSTGSDHIDLTALEEKDIHFISLNDDKSFIEKITSTAELTWLLILACYRKARCLIDRVLIEKSWNNADIRGQQLAGKTLGIIGFGRLGKMVADYAHAFQMKVIVYDPDKTVFQNEKKYVEPVSLKNLLSGSDIITLHAKLNETSKFIINQNAISLMKKGFVIINSGRGDLMDSAAVREGIRTGIIASVGVDVCNDEYQSTKLPDDPLIQEAIINRNIIITPHAGGSTYDAHAVVFDKIAELIRNYIERK